MNIRAILRKMGAVLLYTSSASSLHAETIWSGKSALTWESTIQVGAEKFKSAENGTVMNLALQKTADDYQNLKIYAPTNGGWKEFSAGKTEGASYSGALVPSFSGKTARVSYALTKSDAENARAFGIVIHGHGAALTEISLSSPKNARENDFPGGNGVFVGKKELSSWSESISVPKSECAGARTGGTITLRLSAPKRKYEYRNVKLYASAPSGWQELTGGKLIGGKLEGAIVPDFSGGTAEIAYTMTESDAEKIRAHGLSLNGYGVTVESVSLSSSLAPSTGARAEIGKNDAEQENAAAAKPESKSPSGTPFALHGNLRVSGASLLDKNGKKIVLVGFSTHGINFGNEFSRYVGEDTFRTLRDDFGANCVRLALYPGDYNGYCNGGDKSALKSIVRRGIDAAAKLGLYVIVDWHVHNFNPNDRWKADAKSFLSEISREYAKSGNVLYEICNEPTGADWDSSLKPYAEEIIPAIRKNAPNSVIIVGTNTWSQDIEGPLNNPLPFRNVMYTFHFYANTHRDSFRARVENCVRAGLPVFITEFGTCDASGNGGFNAEESRKWFDLCGKLGLSHINWSISNKGETASAIQSWCQKTSGWSESDLTESGRLVREHFRKQRQN